MGAILENFSNGSFALETGISCNANINNHLRAGNDPKQKFRIIEQMSGKLAKAALRSLLTYWCYQSIDDVEISGSVVAFVDYSHNRPHRPITQYCGIGLIHC